MSRLLLELWQTRSCPPLASTKWFRTWAKRIRHSISLLRQWRMHWVIQNRGAKVGKLVYISSIARFHGSLGKLTIGDQSAIGRAEIAVDDAVRIGTRVCINDGVRLITGSHAVRATNWPLVISPIAIEDYAWIAIDAIILPGVTIGRGAVVGAGAVVSRDVPAGATVAGNPAKVVSTDRPAELDYVPSNQSALFNAWIAN